MEAWNMIKGLFNSNNEDEGANPPQTLQNEFPNYEEGGPSTQVLYPNSDTEPLPTADVNNVVNEGWTSLEACALITPKKKEPEPGPEENVYGWAPLHTGPKLSTSFNGAKTLAQSSLCRTSCAGIQINYPFGLGDGCGSPYYRHLLVCSFDVDTGGDTLQLRTPSGRYEVRQITYAPDPHLVVTDPWMWNCGDGVDYRRPRTPFSLDSSTHLTLSRQNDFLFFNCSEEAVIVGPRPLLCEQSPDRCASSCDSSSYLCRHLPNCGSALSRVGPACCSYYPKASESLRLMLRHCSTYTSVYWKSAGVGEAVAPPPEYGVRVDFEIPVTGRCLDCQERRKGGGTCGFDTTSLEFQCLCEQRNVTTFCKDHSENKKTGGHAGAIAGTMSVVSVAGVFGVGGGIWYLRKMKATTPVTCGVQSNENRLF